MGDYFFDPEPFEPVPARNYIFESVRAVPVCPQEREPASPLGRLEGRARAPVEPGGAKRLSSMSARTLPLASLLIHRRLPRCSRLCLNLSASR
jgi:hypothetical protein